MISLDFWEAGVPLFDAIPLLAALGSISCHKVAFLAFLSFHKPHIFMFIAKTRPFVEQF